MQCRINLVPGHRGFQRHIGGFAIADLTNKDDIRILPQQCLDPVREFQDAFTHMGLADHRQGILNRVFQCLNIDFYIIDFI